MGKHRRIVLTLTLVLGLNWQALPVAAETRARQPAAIVIRDVSLDANGRLNGRLVDGQGRSVAGETVAVHQDRRRLDTTRSNERGVFSFAPPKGGVYQISSRKSTAVYRVWSHGTAPRDAAASALIITDSDVVRGQGSGGLRGSLTTIGIGAAVIAGATIAVVEWSSSDGKQQGPATAATQTFSSSSQDSLASGDSTSGSAFIVNRGNSNPSGTSLSFSGGTSNSGGSSINLGGGGSIDLVSGSH